MLHLDLYKDVELPTCAKDDGIPKCPQCFSKDLKFTTSDFILEGNSWRPKDPEKFARLLPALLVHYNLTQEEYDTYSVSEGRAFITRFVDIR